jgi:hypothetical protein
MFAESLLNPVMDWISLAMHRFAGGIFTSMDGLWGAP